jgi:hypothetical protein
MRKLLIVLTIAAFLSLVAIQGELNRNRTRLEISQAFEFTASPLTCWECISTTKRGCSNLFTHLSKKSYSMRSFNSSRSGSKVSSRLRDVFELNQLLVRCSRGATNAARSSQTAIKRLVRIRWTGVSWHKICSEFLSKFNNFTVKTISSSRVQVVERLCGFNDKHEDNDDHWGDGWRSEYSGEKPCYF